MSLSRPRASARWGDDMFGHEVRYRLAAGYLKSTDVVVDAACGTGYGAPILGRALRYVGVDIDLSDLEVPRGLRHMRKFVERDLVKPWDIGFYFDVFVGFETMEHLEDFRPWVELATQARRLIFVSVPVVPTVGVNPHHVHDFMPGEVPKYFAHPDWELRQTLSQPSEQSEVYIFGRRT